MISVRGIALNTTTTATKMLVWEDKLFFLLYILRPTSQASRPYLFMYYILFFTPGKGLKWSHKLQSYNIMLL